MTELDPKVTAALVAAGVLASDVPVEGGTHFSRLSDRAQKVIVDMVLGEDPPADLEPEVRQEIIDWCNIDEENGS